MTISAIAEQLSAKGFLKLTEPEDYPKTDAHCFRLQGDKGIEILWSDTAEYEYIESTVDGFKLYAMCADGEPFAGANLPDVDSVVKMILTYPHNVVVETPAAV